MIRPVTLVIVLALVGCQSADVQRAQPTLTIPAAWRADVGPASPVEGVWWRNFHDSALNQYVDRALRYNSDVLIARERVNEYQARAYAADSSLFPSPAPAPARSPPPPACRSTARCTKAA